MNILVTGGAGFIGSNFVKYMLERHYRIINLDALTYAGNIDNLSDINSDKYKLVVGNICNQELVNYIIQTENIECIINFAAESHVDRSITNPEIFVQTNVLGTQILLNSAKKNNVKKFIQVSTDEVYGSLGCDGYFTELTPISPNSPYSASKASADMLVKAYYETYGLAVNITRCSNNYGPYQFPEKLIPLMISNAIEDKPLPVYGDGKNVRDWLHVHDHCSAIEAVLLKGKPGEVYNIGGNNEKQNIEIVNLILENLGKPKSLINYVEDRLGHDRRYAIDSSKIQNELGWSAKYQFETGIVETINWYLGNREWLNNINSGAYRTH